MRRRLGIALAAAATAVLVGCSSITLPLPCDLMILAVPFGSTLQAGDPVPADTQVLAAPGDFDTTRSGIVTDADGANTLRLQLRGAAVARVAGHTAAHLGEQVALVINGEVVAVPIVESPIPAGEISIIPATIDNATFPERFAGCVR